MISINYTFQKSSQKLSHSYWLIMSYKQTMIFYQTIIRIENENIKEYQTEVGVNSKIEPNEED
jgi:hypothetical protein